MLTSAGLLLAAALAIGLWPGLGAGAQEAAARFHDRAGYAAAALQGDQRLPDRRPPSVHVSIGSGLLFTAAAAALGSAALFRRRLPGGLRRGTMTALRPAINALRFVHSGEVQDYVAWATLGVALLGGAFALTLT
jgi:multicomponent Na+:H+ antiporter subunit D